MSLAINIGYGLWFKLNVVKKMKRIFWTDILTVSQLVLLRRKYRDLMEWNFHNY